MKDKTFYPNDPGYASGADTPLFNQNKTALELKEFSIKGGGDTTGPPIEKDNLSKNYQHFLQFHADNPHVYKLFKQFTFQAIQSGFNHYGTNGIIERIRWHTGVVTKDIDFKINNNHAPYYSRLFEKDFPIHKNFFRKRSIQNN